MSLPYAACIEVLFREAGAAAADRVRAAAAAGFAAVEMWSWSDKDLDALEDALLDSGVALVGMVCEPLAPLVDPASHDDWLEGVTRSLEVARRLRVPSLYLQSGDVRIAVPHEEQTEALASALRAGAERAAGSGVQLLLEPLNSRIDHPGIFLDHTVQALELLERLERPELGLLYDIYHSVTMGETPQRVLAGRVDTVRHVHLADVPGRHEPGSGGLAWQGIVDWLESEGYRGAIGLEYWPAHDTLASLRDLGLNP